MLLWLLVLLCPRTCSCLCLGTITTDVAGAIASAKRGQAVYRAERNGIVQASIGKLSFTDKQLMDNLKVSAIFLLQAHCCCLAPCFSWCAASRLNVPVFAFTSPGISARTA